MLIYGQLKQADLELRDESKSASASTIAMQSATVLASVVLDGDG